MKQANLNPLRFGRDTIKVQATDYNQSDVVMLELLSVGLMDAIVPAIFTDIETGRRYTREKVFYSEHLETTGTPFTKLDNDQIFSTYENPNQRKYEHYLNTYDIRTITLSYDEYVVGDTQVFKNALDTNIIWGEESYNYMFDRLRKEHWIQTVQLQALTNEIQKSGGMAYTVYSKTDSALLEVEESDILEADAGSYVFNLDEALRTITDSHKPTWKSVFSLTEANNNLAEHAPMDNNIVFKGISDVTDGTDARQLEHYDVDILNAKLKLQNMVRGKDSSVFTTVQEMRKGFDIRVNTDSQGIETTLSDFLSNSFRNSWKTVEDRNKKATTTGAGLHVTDLRGLDLIMNDSAYEGKALSDRDRYFDEITLSSVGLDNSAIKIFKYNGSYLIVTTFVFHPFLDNGRHLLTNKTTNNKGVDFGGILSIYPAENYFVRPEQGTDTAPVITDASAITPFPMTRDQYGNITATDSYFEIVKGNTNLSSERVGSRKFANPRNTVHIRFGYTITQPKEGFKFFAFEVPN